MRTKVTVAKTSGNSSHERTFITGLLAINLAKLDKEIEKQTTLLEEWGERLAQAKWRQAHYEERKKTIRSESVISNEKTARNAMVLEATYRTDPAYKDVVKKLNEAIYDVTLAESVCFALAQRKDLIVLADARQRSAGGVPLRKSRDQEGGKMSAISILQQMPLLLVTIGVGIVIVAVLFGSVIHVCSYSYYHAKYTALRRVLGIVVNPNKEKVQNEQSQKR